MSIGYMINEIFGTKIDIIFNEFEKYLNIFMK